MKSYSAKTFKKYCDQLRSQHDVIQQIHAKISYPPFWKRENGFASLCKTIIEQQVSLASARAVYDRLKAHCGEITPAKLAALHADEYRACGITRQKAKYLTLLAERLIIEPAFFTSLDKMKSEAVKEKLISLKGIGHWTANVYMLVALNRINIYPDFDVALISSIAHEAFEGKKIDNQTAKKYIACFSPLQSLACLYFYHAYIARKKVVFVP